MKAYLFLLLSFLTLTVRAQEKTEGVVTYERVQHWAKIIQRLPFLSKEEKDRVAMTWGNNNEGWKTKMKLFMSPTQSLYTHESEQGQSEDGQYSWRNDDLIIHRNFEQGRKTELIEMLGKTYLVEDSLVKPKWKILNQLKDIAGYVCMKAETVEPIKGQKLTAWFAGDIPVSAGPEQSFGLPGLIMELDINDGDVVITATNVEWKSVEKEASLPKKLKGKKISGAEYDSLLRNHITISTKAQRNPYWSLRY